MGAIEILSLFLSIIGACAWLPELYRIVAFNTSKIQGNVIDVLSVTKFKLNTKKAGAELREGLMLVVAVNFFIYYKSLFIDDFNIEITLDSDSQEPVIATIGNQVNFYNHDSNGNKIAKKLEIPFEYNIFINPLLVSGENNIRIFPCHLQGVFPEEKVTMENIKKIKFSFWSTGLLKRKKEIFIHCDGERFSTPNYLNSFVRDR